MKRVNYKRFENLTNRQKRNHIRIGQGNVTSSFDSSLPRIELDNVPSVRSNIVDFNESVMPFASSVSLSDYKHVNTNRTFPDLQECEISSDENSSVNDIFVNSSVNDISENTFTKKLAKCFLDMNFMAVQSNAILKVLRSHPCFQYLPKDMRTLVHTSKSPVQTIYVEPGQY